MFEHAFYYAQQMGKSRAERTWPRPTSTRHVWVRSRDLHPQQPPDQGLLVAWKKGTQLQWMAFVIVVCVRPGEDPVVVQRWVLARDVRPVAADPNLAFGLR